MVEPLEQQDKAASPPPHTVVFSYFMRQLIAYLPDKPALFEILMELAKNKRNSVDHISRWASNPDKFDWAEGLDEKTLASLVHRVYTAFCELMGPVLPQMNVFTKPWRLVNKNRSPGSFRPRGFFKKRPDRALPLALSRSLLRRYCVRFRTDII
ncbi:hypothetical protein [Methylobacter sp.]|uniref:hypothetical protein n=1 Tax=Methylobacter sp. TaxID=2051955 RepID=UPI003DA3A516